MPLLDLICLANARKRSERCVACLRTDGAGWIRLVSGSDHGELTYAQRNLGQAGEPQNFDLIRVEVVQARPRPGQPENCLVGSRPWKLLERPAGPHLQSTFAKHLRREDLIFGNGTDRLRAAEFDRSAPVASLSLLKPRSVSFSHEILGSKKRVRALFRLRQNSFNFSVTDPPFEERIKGLPAGIYDTSTAGVPDEDRLFFCASLGERFDDGNCYKLVAGVLTLPQNWSPIA